MNKNFHQYLKLLGQSVLFWTLAMICYAVFRYFGMDQDGAMTVKAEFEGRIFKERLMVLSVMGFGLGILYAFVDFGFDRYVPKKMPLGMSILVKTWLYFVVTVLMASAVLNVASQILDFDFDFRRGWWRTDKRFWSAVFYIVLASFVFSFVKIAIERFGRGVFLKVLLGKYKNPQEEERIFMFLDLKDSTTIAEQLGHHKYSQFIQDCFYDLNTVVLQYDAEIYQYVGDEAVLSWSYDRGLVNNNCIGVFFAFQEQRTSRKEYYLEKYGVYPEFKAGLHGGALMVAEVGFVKKELAYHGDVINTSARIQAECNKYNVTLLLSEKLLNDLSIDQLSTSKSLGNVLLKGKHKEVKIHTIDQL